MDPSAPFLIAVGGLGTSVCGATIGAIYGGFGTQPWIPLVTRSAARSGLLGWSFFGIREVLISPALVSFLPLKEYERRRMVFQSSAAANAEGVLSPGTTESLEDLPMTSWGDLRREKLLDSCLSGGLIGVLYGIRKGRILAPTFTMSLACSILQYTANEVAVQRLKYIARKDMSSTATSTTSLSESPSHTSSPEPVEEAGKSRLRAWNDSLNRFWLEFWPRKLTDEEYAERIKGREDRLKRKAEADQRVAKEKPL